MSLKFMIKNTADKAVKEGDTILRYSGVSEPFNRHSERESRAIEVNEKGDPTKWRFTTGLEEDQVEFYKWYNPDEQTALKESIQNLRPIIERFYGGKEVVSPHNFSFWKKTRDVSRLSLTNEDVDVFFDTDKPSHALLYLSIASGAFSDLVAPTKEWADRYQIPHYMMLEQEANDALNEDEDVKRSDAHAALAELRKESGKDALFILGWCIQYDTNAYGAYNYNTSERDLVSYHIKYIDGKLQMKKKRDCPKTFIDYAEKWKGQQTRPALYTEAYVKAGEYFSFISQREKKYVTSDGTILGNTIQEAVSNLMKPKFNQDLEKLRDQVENKWKE